MARRALTVLSRALRLLGFLAATIALLILTGWAVLMLHYSNLPLGWLRNAAAAGFVVIAAGLFVLAAKRGRPRWHAAVVFLVVWAGLVVWFRLIPPSQTREWQRDVARPPRAKIAGDRVTIENVRNFAYRSETEFEERWETREYDLSKLDGHDLMFVYWGSPAIAHTMISFRFRDDAAEGGYSFLPISIEVRKEKSESYSTIAGFFRQFELYYVIADERDVVGLRTNHRGEDVYIMRTLSTPDRSRQILLDYLQGANALSRQAKWYNALTDNCTNGIVYHVRAIGDTVPITYELVFSGYSDRYVYRAGGFDQTLPFDELKARSRINDSAAGNDHDPAFSAIIRRGLPGYTSPAGPN
jgi:hypothetical protein